MHKSSVRLASIYWVIFCSLLTSVVAYLNICSNEAEDNINMLKELSRYRSVIEETVNRYFTLVQALEAFVHTHDLLYQEASENNLYKEKFNLFTQSLGLENQSVLSLQLAPKGIVTFVTEEEKNAKAIGFDLLKDDTRRDQVIKTIIDRSTVIAGPLTLIQGGNAIIVRKAIFTESGTFKAETFYKERRAKETDTWPHKIPSNFWGFATMLIDSDQLLKEFGFDQILEGYSLALRGRHGLGKTGEVF